MSEWLNVSLSKSDKVKAFGGSNPPLCATTQKYKFWQLMLKKTQSVAFVLAFLVISSNPLCLALLRSIK